MSFRNETSGRVRTARKAGPLLFAAVLAFGAGGAGAQNPGDNGGSTVLMPMMMPRAMMRHAAPKRQAAKVDGANAGGTAEAGAASAGYPPCSRAVHDSCTQPDMSAASR